MAHFIGVNSETGIERKAGVQCVVCDVCRGYKYETGGKKLCQACNGSGEKNRRGDGIVTKETK